MDNRRDTETTLTEPFNLTVDLTPMPKKGPSVKLVPVGLLDLGRAPVEHKMEVRRESFVFRRISCHLF